ncbi:MAG: hypothetical protein FJY60_04730 [Betaproteobacteria bacterium]|nr:hypothetical protein [Betaproteobacteria bacterium]
MGGLWFTIKKNVAQR